MKGLYSYWSSDENASFLKKMITNHIFTNNTSFVTAPPPHVPYRVVYQKIHEQTLYDFIKCQFSGFSVKRLLQDTINISVLYEHFLSFLEGYCRDPTTKFI